MEVKNSYIILIIAVLVVVLIAYSFINCDDGFEKIAKSEDDHTHKLLDQADSQEFEYFNLENEYE